MLTGEYSSNATPVSSAFNETLILLKVWALQRGFLRGHDAFTTTTLAVLLVYLYRTKQIGRRMGSMQAFTGFMKFWSEVDWLGDDSLDASACAGSASKAEAVLKRKLLKKAAFVIPEEGRNESQTIDHCKQARLYLKDVRENNNGADGDHTPKTLLDSYKLHYTSSSSAFTICSSHHDSPILLDPTMTINYLARLSPSFVRESRAEAHAALKCIHGHEREEVGGGAFRKLFLETNRFWTRYDAYLRIPLGAVPRLGGSSYKKKRSKGDVSDRRVWGKDVDDVGYNESVCRGVVEVLSLALGDRVSVVRALTSGNGDIRGSLSAESADDVATKYITDSDQCLAVPIRGAETNHVYNVDPSMRSAHPPVLALNQQDQCLVVALRIDPNASRRVVDRGPPAEDVEGSTAFVALWGEAFAQLRRFQDGAIVRAVVWNTPSPDTTRPDNVRFSGDDKFMGGIVEKVAQHIVKLHFGKAAQSAQSPKLVAFELRNMVSFIDGVSSEKPSSFADSISLHKNVILAFDSLSDFLRRNSATSYDTSVGKNKKASKLGLPLSIDEVEPLSPCLRYSSLFPPVPHPLLGGVDLGDKRKVSGVINGEPILIQIRFEGSSKWPSSLNAMGAAKCAMLIQLADGIKKMKDERSTSEDIDAFDGPMDVTPNHLILGYRGYSFKIIVRADQELRMLKGLKNPTDEAKELRLVSSANGLF
jgi:U3 small nucleolar RNA-associated protein 22